MNPNGLGISIEFFFFIENKRSGLTMWRKKCQNVNMAKIGSEEKKHLQILNV